MQLIIISYRPDDYQTETRDDDGWACENLLVFRRFDSIGDAAKHVAGIIFECPKAFQSHLVVTDWSKLEILTSFDITPLNRGKLSIQTLTASDDQLEQPLRIAVAEELAELERRRQTKIAEAKAELKRLVTEKLRLSEVAKEERDRKEYERLRAKFG